MVAPAVIAAGIQAAASIGSAVASKQSGGPSFPEQVQYAKTRKREKQWRSEDYKRFLENREYESRSIQRTVADAKASGIHPLYALGAGPSGGGGGLPPSFGPASGGFMGGQSPSGSALGEGIRGVASAASGYIKESAKAPYYAANMRQIESQTAVNEALAMKYASEAKRAESDALNVRSFEGWEPGRAEMAKVHPLGTKVGAPLRRRPIVSTGRTSVPQFVEIVGPHGRRMILNPEMGLDEVGQVDYMVRPYMEWLKTWKARRRWDPKWRSSRWK